MANYNIEDGMSYRELLASPLSVSIKSLAHYRSALNRFIIVQGKTIEDKVGTELMGGFDYAIQKFIENQYNGDANLARSAVSCLRNWRELYNTVQRTQDLPLNFRDALKEVVRRDGRSMRQLSTEIGQPISYISNLINGRQKSAPQATLVKLERILNILEGTLSSLAPYYNIRINAKFCPVDKFPVRFRELTRPMEKARRKIRSRLPDEFQNLSSDDQDHFMRLAVQSISLDQDLSIHANRISQNTKLRYVLSGKLTCRLQKEFDDVTVMKTTLGSLGKPNRDLRWSPATSERWGGQMRAFLGFCLLSNTAVDTRMRGPNLELNTLTLGLIISAELINEYLIFRRARTNGSDSTTTKGFLESAICLLRANSGWVAGHPELMDRLPQSTQLEIAEAGGWNAQCARQHQYLIDLKDSLDFEISRDPFMPIMPMIETGRPLDLVQQGIARMRERLDEIERSSNITPITKAIMWRNYILINLISWFPLRAKHWHLMSYIAAHQSFYTNKKGGHLRYINGTDLGFYIGAKEFKNSKNNSIFGPKKDRDVKFLLKDAQGLRDIEPLLKLYMEKYRPLLCAGDGPVFPDISGAAITPAKVNQIVTDWSRNYLSEFGNIKYGLRLKGVTPFGPHAFRHLMASHIIMTTGSIAAAANILLDNPKMIEKHYGIFLPGDRLLTAFKQLDARKDHHS